ncbi:tRNA (guanine-N(7)-)-methyltransferase [Fictibacillus macauensis ZFHKF-1]|uniref:tRNA (guanine-N(7)-)-methyltransferase n=1 Tax=Fictibacillus macauensis ZFHKF-1 TaxID=1196324 RepID=I8UF53_9BACL|nr:tRNA (guanosine(46)-N7)-methyltransferase TrmB [Fictibacillus macauensis]EIT85505.1 tRNA (guanine-N(7)-)-methyltransferase [Fictibacillus macauensis ZFHKF-1]
MRQRFKPWAKEKLAEHAQIAVADPAALKGKWHEFFGNHHPIHIEVGTGKGQFITGMGTVNQDVNYIGMEIYDSIIVTALDRIIEAELPNVKIIRENAQKLTEFFEEGEVDRVYLNFSDPWPKKKHEKRRLTHESFLSIFEHILVDEGEIHFKTDNQGLFEYSLHSMSKYGMTLNQVWLDLHASDYEGNIMTEYEEKFSAKGFRIYRTEAQFKKR